MAFCTGCGRMGMPGAAHCGECGTRLPGAPATPEEGSVPAPVHPGVGRMAPATDGPDLLKKLTQVPAEDPEDTRGPEADGDGPIYGGERGH